MPPFACAKTNYGRDYCETQCTICAHRAAGGQVDPVTGIPVPLDRPRYKPPEE